MSDQRAKSQHRGKKNAVREMPEEDPDFQIAPMIDVLLVLLVFFMSISSTEVLQSTKGIDLPVAAQGNDASKTSTQVIVNISWNALDQGAISVNEKNYPTAADLTQMLVEHVSLNTDVRVLIRADKQTKYEYLRGVMVAVGLAKVGNVTFSVVDKESPKGAVAAAP